MSRYLRRAAVAAAAAVALSAAAMGGASDRSLSSSFSLLSSSPAHAPGHLSLARNHPELRGLDALLTSKSFLLDATHALSAAALRSQPLSRQVVAKLRLEDVAKAFLADMESKEGPDKALRLRIQVALVAAEDGRFDDALDALALIAAERPSDPRPRLSAAGICYLTGMVHEGNQWVSGIPEVIRQENKDCLRDGILAAALGGAPGAIAGFEGLVGYSAFEVIEIALWANFLDGNLSFLKTILLRALLWRALVAGKYKDYCQGKVTVTGSQQKNDLGLDDTISRDFVDENHLDIMKCLSKSWNG
ncbi:hypothetical protein EJB05_13164, partial [Eragrostis curvula]